MMGESAGMTRRNVALFNTSMRDESEGSSVQRRAETTRIPLVSTSRTARGIYSCVDSGKLWSIKKQISNSVETARYKHYSACNGIFSPPTLSHSAFSSTLECFERHHPFNLNFRVSLRVR